MRIERQTEVDEVKETKNYEMLMKEKVLKYILALDTEILRQKEKRYGRIDKEIKRYLILEV